jgi:hypothetical protein
MISILYKLCSNVFRIVNHAYATYYTVVYSAIHRQHNILKCTLHRVHSHAPSIRSHRGIKVVWPDFQPMRVPEEPVCVHLFRQKPVFTSLHLKSPVHVHRLSSPTTLSVYTSLYNISSSSKDDVKSLIWNKRGAQRRGVKKYLGWMRPSYLGVPAPPVPESHETLSDLYDSLFITWLRVCR